MDETYFYPDDKYINVLWYDKLNKLKIYIHENKNLPQRNSIDNQCKKLYNWMCTQRMRYNDKNNIIMHSKFYKLWGEFIEEYDYYFKPNEKLWKENLNKLKQYINKNKKLPSNYSKKYENIQFCNWIKHQKDNYKYKINIMTNDEIYKLWDNFTIEYSEYFKPSIYVWKEYLNKLKQYINENNKLPSYHIGDHENIKLGNWYKHQIKNYALILKEMKIKEIYDLWSNFVNEYNKYFKSNEEIWIDRLNKIKYYINENKKLPHIDLNNNEITQMFKWIKYQKENYKLIINNMKNENIYKLWGDFIKEYSIYFKTKKEILFDELTEIKKNWIIKLNEIIYYINKNKNFPYECMNDYNYNEYENDYEYMQYCYWIQQQQDNFINKSNIMLNKDIYNIWNNFIINYSIYDNLN
jgi:hypothetical protein